jgi:3-hydroxyisobutyrate dehydrogenase
LSSNESPTVAVLGTGIIGAAVARNLRRHGLAVRVWNRTRSRAQPLAEDGALVTDTPADAVRGADVVLTVLTDGATVLDTLTSAAPGLAAGTVLAQLSTVGVAAVEPLARFAEAHGLRFVDAPVQGTRGPAEQGQLVLLAAGPTDVRPVLAPVFDAIGRRTLWVADTGANGAASRLKLVLNSWAFALTHGVAEALALADGLGVDPAHFVDVVTGGPMDNAYFQLKGAAIGAGDYTTSFSVRNAEKDARLVLAAAEQAGVRLDVAEAGWHRFQRATAAGHGDLDMAASHLVSRPPAD